MMVPLLLSLKENKPVHNISMERFYDHISISRQGFSKAALLYRKEKEMMEALTPAVRSYRLKVDRRAGSRSIFHNLDIKSRFGIGANKFERMLSSHGLTLPALKTRVVTTKSSLQSWNYPSLVNGLSLNGINQLVVGDLTYLNIGKDRYYLFCLTDVYSARIVGYALSENMRAKDAKTAQDKWFRLRGKKNLVGCIHHTDGGKQYFSALYLNALNEVRARVSCAKNCLMNGYAEQRNGLIKHHLIPTVNASDESGLKKEMERIINIYNHKRKQKDLGWLSPVEFEKAVAGLPEKPYLHLYQYEKNKKGF